MPFLFIIFFKIIFVRDGMSRTLTFVHCDSTFGYFKGRFPGEHHVIFHHNLTMKRLL